MIKKSFAVIALGFAVMLLSACGFQPIYATPDEPRANGLLRNVNVASIISSRDAGEGNLAVQPILRRELQSRLLQDGSGEMFDLHVEVTPVARRLAVQLDASVTRLNYTLNSRYRLIHRDTGAMIRGNLSAIASFNQVTSQYSSLFAEREAVEKSARRLAEQIERDILLQQDEFDIIIDRAKKRGQKPVKDQEIFDVPEDYTPFDPDFDPELIPGR